MFFLFITKKLESVDILQSPRICSERILQCHPAANTQCISVQWWLCLSKDSLNCDNTEKTLFKSHILITQKKKQSHSDNHTDYIVLNGSHAVKMHSKLYMCDRSIQQPTAPKKKCTNCIGIFRCLNRHSNLYM